MRTMEMTETTMREAGSQATSSSLDIGRLATGQSATIHPSSLLFGVATGHCGSRRSSEIVSARYACLALAVPLPAALCTRVPGYQSTKVLRYPGKSKYRSKSVQTRGGHSWFTRLFAMRALR